MGMALAALSSKDYKKIIIQYRTFSESLKMLKAEMENKLILEQCDFSDKNETLAFIERVIESGFIPDHIVHFAATKSISQRFHKIGWNKFSNEIDISVRSLILILSKLLPYMMKKRYGKIVILLSQVVNNMPYPNIADYVSVKYMLLGLMKSLAVEYASKGITVNAVSPNWVNTKFINMQPQILVRSHAESSPIGRILECEDVVPTIKFLLSDKADCINGQNIFITCGE